MGKFGLTLLIYYIDTKCIYVHRYIYIENVCSILHDINLFEWYDQYEKNYQQNNFST